MYQWHYEHIIIMYNYYYRLMIFALSSLKQENFIVDIKSKLREKEVPHDLAEAEDMLKKHMDLKDEIAANRER
jgi:hypothetical protein